MLEKFVFSRQINIRLAKDSDRVVRYLINIDQDSLSQDSLEMIKRITPVVQRKHKFK